MVTRLRRANGQVLGATYDSRGNIATENDSSTVQNGVTAITTYQFDQLWDFVTSIDPPAHDVVTMAYDATTGNRLYQQDARGGSSRTTFSYSATSKLLTQVVDPLSNTSSVGYDATLGNPDTTTTSLGTQTVYVRDAIGRLVVTRAPFDVGAAFHTTDSVTYDAMDRQLAAVTSAPAYNGVSAESTFVRTDYDPEGAVGTVRRSQDPDPPGIGTLVTSTVYDAVGRKIKAVAVDGHSDSMVYDPAGNLLQRVSPRADTGGGGPRYIITAVYDSLNRVKTRVIPTATYQDTTSFMQTYKYIHLQQDATQFPYYPNTGAGSLKYRVPADTELYSYDAVSNVVQADNRSAQIRRRYNKNGTLAIDSLRIRTVARLDSGGNFTTHQYELRY